MEEFKLTARCVISVDTVVQAETLDEAIKIAEGRTDILHGVFEDPDENSQWVADEVFGMPYDIQETVD